MKYSIIIGSSLQIIFKEIRNMNEIMNTVAQTPIEIALGIDETE